MTRRFAALILVLLALSSSAFAELPLERI